MKQEANAFDGGGGEGWSRVYAERIVRGGGGEEELMVSIDWLNDWLRCGSIPFGRTWASGGSTFSLKIGVVLIFLLLGERELSDYLLLTYYLDSILLLYDDFCLEW